MKMLVSSTYTLNTQTSFKTFWDNVATDEILPPNGNFDLGSQHSMGQDYPLIGAETGDYINITCFPFRYGIFETLVVTVAMMWIVLLFG